jgi:hypothetical protein
LWQVDGESAQHPLRTADSIALASSFRPKVTSHGFLLNEEQKLQNVDETSRSSWRRESLHARAVEDIVPFDSVVGPSQHTRL